MDLLLNKYMLHTRLDIETHYNTHENTHKNQKSISNISIFCFPSQTVIHYLPIFKRKVKLNSFYRILVNHDANFYLNFYYLALDAKKNWQSFHFLNVGNNPSNFLSIIIESLKWNSLFHISFLLCGCTFYQITKKIILGFVCKRISSCYM